MNKKEYKQIMKLLFEENERLKKAVEGAKKDISELKEDLEDKQKEKASWRYKTLQYSNALSDIRNIANNSNVNCSMSDIHKIKDRIKEVFGKELEQ
jgi:hypothetical protein